MATWPLAAHLTTAVPLGTEREATVPVFSIWNLWWTADRIPHAFAGFLDAPFFYPNPGVTTYSEPMPLLGALVSPLWIAGAPPALAYNVALLAALTLNGIFAYRLARALGALAAPALVAGALAVTLPFTANFLGVLQTTGLFGMLWTLDGLVRFGRSGAGAWAAWAAAGFAATFFTFQQYALFFAPAALAAALVALGQQRFRLAPGLRLGVAGLLGLFLVLVLALPTTRRHAAVGGFERPPEVVEALSARPRDFLTRPATAVVPVPRRDPADTAGLFPGALLAALAAAGAFAGLRDPASRRWVAVLVGTAAFGFLLALGLNLDLFGWRPFGTLRAHVGAVAEIRSPYRAAAIVQVCLPVLAAVALARVPVRGARRGTALVAALGLLAAAENLAVPATLHTVPSSARTAWTSWLREHPGRTVLAHVPFAPGLRVADYEVEAWRLFAQTDHGKPIVNGYSGFFPVVRTPDGRVFPAYTAFQLRMAREFPSYRLLCVLSQSLRADTLVAERAWLAANSRAIAAFRNFLRPVYSDGEVRIYALEAPPSECRAR